MRCVIFIPAKSTKVECTPCETCVAYLAAPSPPSSQRWGGGVAASRRVGGEAQCLISCKARRAGSLLLSGSFESVLQLLTIRSHSCSLSLNYPIDQSPTGEHEGAKDRQRNWPPLCHPCEYLADFFIYIDIKSSERLLSDPLFIHCAVA